MSFVWKAGMANPEVIRGDIVVKDNTYKLAAGQTFKTGELIRITNAGTVAVAGTTDATTGPVHGMALANSATTAVPSTNTYGAGDFFPVALFAGDTELAIQCNGSVDQGDLAIGQTYDLDVTSNKWSITSTTTNGIAKVLDNASQLAWFDPKADASLAKSRVIIGFTQANLDAHGAL